MAVETDPDGEVKSYTHRGQFGQRHGLGAVRVDVELHLRGGAQNMRNRFNSTSNPKEEKAQAPASDASPWRVLRWLWPHSTLCPNPRTPEEEGKRSMAIASACADPVDEGLVERVLEAGAGRFRGGAQHKVVHHGQAARETFASAKTQKVMMN